MFNTLPLLNCYPHHAGYYVPQVPSPLSSPPLHSTPLFSRDGNIPRQPRLRLQMPSPTVARNRKDNPYSKRVTRSNPLIHDRGDGRETRRKLFLKKVREDSEDKRWNARGGEDEMMRTIWMAEEMRRAERQAREATYVPASQEDEEDIAKDTGDELRSSATQSKDEAMAYEVAQQEEAELEALLSMNDAEHTADPPEPYESLETSYASDDEEYDHIFLEVINEESRLVNKQSQEGDLKDIDQDVMDIN